MALQTFKAIKLAWQSQSKYEGSDQKPFLNSPLKMPLCLKMKSYLAVSFSSLAKYSAISFFIFRPLGLPSCYLVLLQHT